ncbi:MAG: response regulator [Acidobacteriaceae bacterium]|nr:response regulator [Acidobacteriaceae bacterium]
MGLIREALSEHCVHCELSVITDGHKAMELIADIEQERTPRPDLVLLDLKLPKRDGSEVLERVRASEQCRDIPVIILTSSNAKEDRETAVRLGATRYIRKPHRLEEFIQLGAVFKQILQGTQRQ